MGDWQAVSGHRGSFAKYMLLQLPGYVLTALVLLALRSWITFPVWIVVAAVLIGLVKDLVVFNVVRNSFDADVATGVERLIGMKGVASESLNPTGYVKLNSELWRARVHSDEGEIPAGDPIVVRALDGMTLIVSRAHD
jgi:membrane protein implicated in regulation of membrane protease activity